MMKRERGKRGGHHLMLWLEIFSETKKKPEREKRRLLIDASVASFF